MGRGRAAQSFEELHVYQQARELTNMIYKVTRQGDFSRDFGLSDQIRREAVSIMSNIAEGFERGSKTGFIQFLYIAKGSSGEVRVHAQIARDQDYIAESDFQNMVDTVRRISGMLSNFIAHLQQSMYQGEKVARPQRQAVTAQKARVASLRAAQAASIRARDERESPKK